jgi:hypothetical protein
MDLYNKSCDYFAIQIGMLLESTYFYQYEEKYIC